MLKLHIPAAKLFIENTNSFVDVKETDLVMEHSLLSLKKWEAIYHKPFLPKSQYIREDHTAEENIVYFQCMTITPKNPDISVYLYLATNQEMIQQISDYMTNPMTATTFKELPNQKKNGAPLVVTASVIYAWMAISGIPFECQTWHLNELITLIRTVGELQKEPTKMNPKEAAAYRKQVSAMNRARMRKH